MSESESELVTIQITFGSPVAVKPTYLTTRAELERIGEAWARGDERGTFDVFISRDTPRKLMLDFTHILYID